MEAAPKQNRAVVFGLIAVIIVLGAAFGLYFVEATGTISSKDRTISSQSAQLSNDVAQISADEASVTNLTSTVASLRQTVAADSAEVSSLTAGYTRANGTIATLNSQITSLNAQIASDNSQIAALQSQVTSLQAISTLSSNEALVTSQLFTTNSSGLLELGSFTTQYAGYLSITATSSSDPANVGCFVDNTFAANVLSPDFSGIVIPGGGFFLVFGSIPATLVFPVTPGTVAVYLATADLTAQNATVAVTYFY